MKHNIIVTEDGSHSICIPEMNVTYHSVHGAIGESIHVFIEAGLCHAWKNNDQAESLHIVEMGFGTGLNAILTLAAAEENKRKISYEAIEPFPIANSMVATLNYCEQLRRPGLQPLFSQLHDAPWEEEIILSPYFGFKKTMATLELFTPGKWADLVYFDAFAPNAQPELWTTEIFKKLHSMMNQQSVLVTYCSKSMVRRSLLEAGFGVEKIPGPPHKREMLRATKH
jgi:tRNA U34 5-methylaminomethyl-2-thiouridine-forming methyltransferase MnmC